MDGLTFGTSYIFLMFVKPTLVRSTIPVSFIERSLREKVTSQFSTSAADCFKGKLVESFDFHRF